VKDAETIRDLDQRIKAMEVSQISTKSSLEILNARLEKEVRSLQTKLGLEAKKVTTLERSHEKFRNKFLAQAKKLAELEERMRALLPRLIPAEAEFQASEPIKVKKDELISERIQEVSKNKKTTLQPSPHSEGDSENNLGKN